MISNGRSLLIALLWLSTPLLAWSQESEISEGPTAALQALEAQEDKEFFTDFMKTRHSPSSLLTVCDQLAEQRRWVLLGAIFQTLQNTPDAFALSEPGFRNVHAWQNFLFFTFARRIRRLPRPSPVVVGLGFSTLFTLIRALPYSSRLTFLPRNYSIAWFDRLGHEPALLQHYLSTLQQFADQAKVLMEEGKIQAKTLEAPLWTLCSPSGHHLRSHVHLLPALAAQGFVAPVPASERAQESNDPVVVWSRCFVSLFQAYLENSDSEAIEEARQFLLGAYPKLRLKNAKFPPPWPAPYSPRRDAVGDAWPTLVLFEHLNFAVWDVLLERRKIARGHPPSYPVIYDFFQLKEFYQEVSGIEVWQKWKSLSSLKALTRNLFYVYGAFKTLESRGHRGHAEWALAQVRRSLSADNIAFTGALLADKTYSHRPILEMIVDNDFHLPICAPRRFSNNRKAVDDILSRFLEQKIMPKITLTLSSAFVPNPNDDHVPCLEHFSRPLPWGKEPAGLNGHSLVVDNTHTLSGVDYLRLQETLKDWSEKMSDGDLDAF